MISILMSYQYEIYRTTVREFENCSVFSVKYDIVFVLPNTNSNSAIRIEIPHRSIQRRKLYLRMSNVFILNTSILAIYGL